MYLRFPRLTAIWYEDLLNDIKNMFSSDLTHQERCRWAYDFRSGEASRQLSVKTTMGASRETWRSIRHYVGRLGSWSKASRFLVAFARRHPHIFESFQIGVVRGASQTATPIFGQDTAFHHALVRGLPQYNSEHLDRIVQAIQATSDVDIATAFMEKYKSANFVPRVHTEISMAEHFHSNNLAFVRDDRYIGCSKPSCYCCDLYLKTCPGRFETRPCHGNVWIKWCFPFQLDEEDGDKSKHEDEMFRKFIKSMQYDLGSQVLSGISKREYTQESTTCMSELPSMA